MFEPIPLNPYFAARIEGIDLRVPFTPQQIDAFAATIDRFSVLVIPGQKLTDELERLLASAVSQPPGPVYLEVAGTRIRGAAPPRAAGSCQRESAGGARRAAPDARGARSPSPETAG